MKFGIKEYKSKKFTENQRGSNEFGYSMNKNKNFVKIKKDMIKFG